MITQDSIQIDYLANYSQWISTLAGWFYDEWEEFYNGKSMEDVAETIRERLNYNQIPITLVALHENIVIGTVCLKAHDMDTRKDLSPWLAGLYVTEPYRKNGIGTLLVNSIVQEAIRLSISKLYLYTPKTEIFYSGLGWSLLEKTIYKGISVTIMERQLLK